MKKINLKTSFNKDSLKMSQVVMNYSLNEITKIINYQLINILQKLQPNMSIDLSDLDEVIVKTCACNSKTYDISHIYLDDTETPYILCKKRGGGWYDTLFFGNLQPESIIKLYLIIYNKLESYNKI